MQLPLLQTLTSLLPFTPAASTMSAAEPPAWLPSLSTSLAKNTANYFTLSTVAEPLIPRARTVTFAGFLETPETSGVFMTASNAKANKVKDISTVSENVEAVFWFADEWTQVRVKGIAVPITYYEDDTSTEKRSKVEKVVGKIEWKELIQGVWDKQNKKVVKSQYPETTEEEPVPRAFVVICIVPEEVEVFAPGKGMKKSWKAGMMAGVWVWDEV